MFENITAAAPDPIFGLSEAFRRDSNPAKVTLGAGVYKDERGRTPILAAVHEAEARLLESELTKSYLPIDGASRFAELVTSLVLGDSLAPRAATAHTPGGTAALRIAAELTHRLEPDATVFISDPTWVNHRAIFESAGLRVATYRYLDRQRHRLDLEALLEDLKTTRPKDLVILHGCCHNPTGVDPSIDEWKDIASCLASSGAVPLIDFAYQGFVESVDRDRQHITQLAETLPELLVCSSYSKNFGLYNERVGALIAVCADPSDVAAVASRIKSCVRPIYSNPPAHGAAIVTEILDHPSLRSSWSAELATMRDRIRAMRIDLVAGLDRRGVSLSTVGNSFIVRQNGMFSFTGLSSAAVTDLRENHSIYLVDSGADSGRINVAGINSRNIDLVCDSIAAVISQHAAR